MDDLSCRYCKFKDTVVYFSALDHLISKYGRNLDARIKQVIFTIICSKCGDIEFKRIGLVEPPDR